mmetsp:Transcript_20400/g.46302  ORF Transcript_20400/g.46302 Transcript_20400/m.46302 type:complete len:219 (+) Transcript_20400:476-1132(+)
MQKQPSLLSLRRPSAIEMLSLEGNRRLILVLQPRGGLLLSDLPPRLAGIIVDFDLVHPMGGSRPRRGGSQNMPGVHAAVSQHRRLHPGESQEFLGDPDVGGGSGVGGGGSGVGGGIRGVVFAVFGVEHAGFDERLSFFEAGEFLGVVELGGIVGVAFAFESGAGVAGLSLFHFGLEGTCQFFELGGDVVFLSGVGHGFDDERGKFFFFDGVDEGVGHP